MLKSLKIGGVSRVKNPRRSRYENHPTFYYLTRTQT